MPDTTENPPRHEMRSHYVPLIEKMFNEHAAVTNDMLCDKFGMLPNTAGSYLRHLHRDLRIIRKGERRGDGKQEWVLGEDFNLPPIDDERAQRTVPARQIGMWRHWMDVALFGPALRGAQEVAA